MNLHNITNKEDDILNYLTQRFRMKFWWEGATIRYISNETDATTVMTIQPSEVTGWVAQSLGEWINEGRPQR